MEEKKGYQTLNDFLKAIEEGKVDKSKITLYWDGYEFSFVNDENNEELVSGDVCDVFERFIAIHGIKCERT